MTCWYHATPSKLCDKCMDAERRRLEAAPVGGIEYLATPVTCAAPGWARVDLPADQSAKLPEPRIHADQVYVMSQPGFEQHFARLFDAHKDSGPPGCECPPCAERREQRAHELTAEKRRDAAELSKCKTESAVRDLVAAKRAEMAAEQLQQAYRDWLVYGSSAFLVNEKSGDIQRVEPDFIAALAREVDDATDALRYATSYPGQFVDALEDAMWGKTLGEIAAGIRGLSVDDQNAAMRARLRRAADDDLRAYVRSGR